MNIGYACLTVGVLNTKIRSVTQKNASPGNLFGIIGENLSSLEAIIEYNIANNINLFRISSDLIPFGSSPVNDLPWWELFAGRFDKIGAKARDGAMRLSMHPGQYTVLNSPRRDVVEKAVKDLDYHEKVLKTLGTNSDNKIVLHLGGAYGSKKESIKRFRVNFGYLDQGIRDRLVLENDDRTYNIADVLDVGCELGLPVVFDNLHHAVNGSGGKESDRDWIAACAGTWREGDGRQKIHYSQQDPLRRAGAHTKTITVKDFLAYCKELQDLDVMLEVKDKNLSALKCINCLDSCGTMASLEKEWGRYKYTVMEGSPAIYGKISDLLQDKNSYPAVEFYTLVERALIKEVTAGNAINAAEHVWGYFRFIATDEEKEKVSNSINKYATGTLSLPALKERLRKLALKYDQHFLLQSYYFDL